MTTDGIARTAVAEGEDAAKVADALAEQLRGDGLRLAVAFADWRLDPARFAQTLQRALGKVPAVGCTAIAVVGDPADRALPAARGLGLYGDWVRAGIGVAPELPSSPLARSRDAVYAAAAMLRCAPDRLDPARHVAFTLVDGTCGHEERFCIGSAAAVPQIRFVGGSASTEIPSPRRSFVWSGGEALADAGLVVVLESELPFEAVTSSHLVATELKTVVTACSGRRIDELDGQPAAPRLRALVAALGGTFDEARMPEFSFARFIDGVPYVRSITRIAGSQVCLASAVEAGQVLRVMQAGDLIDQTRRDLELAAQRVGGAMSALLVFSCIARHWEAEARGISRELADVYAGYPAVGLQSAGEQSGMLLVNHTLTALAIGADARAVRGPA